MPPASPGTRSDRARVPDKPPSFLKFDFEFLELEPETRQVRPPACCDVTSSEYNPLLSLSPSLSLSDSRILLDRTVGGNIEFDVPACSEGVDPEDCVYEMSSSQTIDMMPNYHHKTVRNHPFVSPPRIFSFLTPCKLQNFNLILYAQILGCPNLPRVGSLGVSAG